MISGSITGKRINPVINVNIDMFVINSFFKSQILKLIPKYKKFKKTVFNIINDGEGIRSKSEAVNFLCEKIKRSLILPSLNANLWFS
ncbi:hypothetical protein DSECCO2_138480 [anaerobic digester metagenome]